MDANQIQSFCTTAAELLTQVGEYASVDPGQRQPEDDALVRQLRVSVGGLSTALMEVARMTPPPMPAMPMPPPVARAA